MVVTLKYLGSSPLWRHAVAALASGVAIASAAALIASFGFLSGLGALPVGSLVVYYSKKLTPLKLNYNIYNKELLAIITVLKEWKAFL